MANDILEASIKRRKTEAKRTGFDSFMDSPATKLLISLVPRSEPVECLSTLLRAAFEQGCDLGEAVTMAYVVESILKAKKE